MRRKASWLSVLSLGCALGAMAPTAQGEELPYEEVVASDLEIELIAFDGEVVLYGDQEFVCTLWPDYGAPDDFIAWSGVAEGEAFEGDFADHGFYEEEPFTEVDVTAIRGLEGGPIDEEALQTIGEPDVEVVIDWIDADWVDEGSLEDGEVFVPEGPLDELIYFSAAGPDSTGTIPEPTTACLLALTLMAATVSRRGRR